MIIMVGHIYKYFLGIEESFNQKKLKKFITKHIDEYFENNKNGNTIIKGSDISPSIIFDDFIFFKSRSKSFLQVLKEIENKYPNLKENDICFSIIYIFAKILSN